MNDYPELEHLMGGWFHQDFDIAGDTLEEIVGEYRAVVPRQQRRGLLAEIARYLAQPGDLDAEFEQRFRPDAIPNAFAPTARAFLERIADLVRDTSPSA